VAKNPDKPFRMAVPFNPETEVDRSVGLRPGTTSVFGLIIGAPGSRGKAPAAVAPKRRYGAPRRRRDWRTPRGCAFSPRHRIARQRLGLRRPSAAFPRGSNFIIHPFHATTATGENTR